ncbi:MAG: inositol monophosphatase family protein [Pseudonocardiaceae bacterium]
MSALDATAARDVLVDAVQRAGSRLLRTWPQHGQDEADGLRPRRKNDGSWVSQADHDSERIITEVLARTVPGAEIVSEEDERSHDHCGRTLWFLDPLDGTRQYLDGSPDFAILLSAWTDGRPVFSVALFPAEGILAIAHGNRASFSSHGCAQLAGPQLAESQPVHAVYCNPPRLRQALPAGTAYRVDTYESTRALVDVARGHAAGAVVLLCGHLAWDVAAPMHLVTAAGGLVSDEHSDAVLLTGTHVPARYLVAARTATLHRLLVHALTAEPRPDAGRPPVRGL